MSNFYIVSQDRSIIDDFGGIGIDSAEKINRDTYGLLVSGYGIRNKSGFLLGFYYSKEQAQYVFDSIINELTARYSNTDDTNKNRIYFMPSSDEIKNIFETDNLA